MAGRLAAVRGASILRACIHKSRTIYPDGVGELRACIHKSYCCLVPKRDGVGELCACIHESRTVPRIVRDATGWAEALAALFASRWEARGA